MPGARLESPNKGRSSILAFGFAGPGYSNCAASNFCCEHRNFRFARFHFVPCRIDVPRHEQTSFDTLE